MTFWSGESLRTKGKQQGIILPFHPDNIDCSAYTLTLGEEFFVTPDVNDKAAERAKKFLEAGELSTVGGVPHIIGKGNLSIPPGQFAFLITNEFLSIPYNVMGFISLKSKIKWAGLINVSGFHVDPGFKGRLVYSVYNAGPTVIHLERHQPVFLLWLADLDLQAKVPDSRIHKEPQLEIPIKLISEMDNPTPSLQTMAADLKTVQNEFEIFRTNVKVLSATFAVLIALAGLAYKIFAG